MITAGAIVTRIGVALRQSQRQLNGYGTITQHIQRAKPCFIQLKYIAMPCEQSSGACPFVTPSILKYLNCCWWTEYSLEKEGALWSAFKSVQTLFAYLSVDSEAVVISEGGK